MVSITRFRNTVSQTSAFFSPWCRATSWFNSWQHSHEDGRLSTSPYFYLFPEFYSAPQALPCSPLLMILRLFLHSIPWSDLHPSEPSRQHRCSWRQAHVPYVQLLSPLAVWASSTLLLISDRCCISSLQRLLIRLFFSYVQPINFNSIYQFLEKIPTEKVVLYRNIGLSHEDICWKKNRGVADKSYQKA